MLIVIFLWNTTVPSAYYSILFLAAPISAYYSILFPAAPICAYYSVLFPAASISAYYSILFPAAPISAYYYISFPAYLSMQRFSTSSVSFKAISRVSFNASLLNINMGDQYPSAISATQLIMASRRANTSSQNYGFTPSVHPALALGYSFISI